jgi:hypothetical protein
VNSCLLSRYLNCWFSNVLSAECHCHLVSGSNVWVAIFHLVYTCRHCWINLYEVLLALVLKYMDVRLEDGTNIIQIGFSFFSYYIICILVNISVYILFWLSLGIKTHLITVSEKWA